MVKVKEIMNRGVVRINSDENIAKAADRMSKKGIGSLIVDLEDDGWGIITERDLVKRVLAKGLDPKKTKVKKVMTKSCCTVDQETELEDANKLMHDQNIRRLPITTDDDIVGIITVRDVAKSLMYYRTRRMQRFRNQRMGSSWD